MFTVGQTTGYMAALFCLICVHSPLVIPLERVIYKGGYNDPLNGNSLNFYSLILPLSRKHYLFIPISLADKHSFFIFPTLCHTLTGNRYMPSVVRLRRYSTNFLPQFTDQHLFSFAQLSFMQKLNNHVHHAIFLLWNTDSRKMPSPFSWQLSL